MASGPAARRVVAATAGAGAGAGAPDAPAPSTREGIAQAALAIVDADGLQALSVRRLGADLGLHYSSIYHHFRNKHDLLGAVSQLVLRDLAVPEPGDEWLSYLAETDLAYRDVLMAHPNVVPLMLEHPDPRRASAREVLVALVEVDGGTADDVDNLMSVAESFAIGLVLVHCRSSAPRAAVGPATDDQMFLDTVRALLLTTFEASTRAAGGG